MGLGSVVFSYVIAVLLVAVQAMSQDQELLDSTLHSTAYGIPVAYIGETVFFTYVVRGSNLAAWHGQVRNILEQVSQLN